jgi:hypothetical protein
MTGQPSGQSAAAGRGERRRHCCVISGDIVGSTHLSRDTRSVLHDVMVRASAQVGVLVGDAMPLEVDIFGGDSWQMLITEPHRALHAGLLYRSYLLACVSPESRGPVDSRMAFAIGPIDSVPTERVSHGQGEAFELSGRALAEMGDRRMTLAIADRTPLADWDVAFRLMDELAIGWTARQARAVSGALRGMRQEEIAGLWNPPIKQPSVADHLRAASWDAFAYAIEAFEHRFRAP